MQNHERIESDMDERGEVTDACRIGEVAYRSKCWGKGKKGFTGPVCWSELALTGRGSSPLDPLSVDGDISPLTKALNSLS